MNTYTPEVAAVLCGIAELTLATVRLEIKDAGADIMSSLFALDEMSDLAFLEQELRRNNVTVKLTEKEMVAKIENIRADILAALNIVDPLAPPVDRSVNATPLVRTMTIVPNIESVVVDAESMGVTAVELSNTDEETCLNVPVDNAALISAADDAIDNAVDAVSEAIVTPDIPVVESPESGKKGSKRRQVV